MFDLVLIATLIVLNALFADSEIALISLGESRLRRRGGARAARLTRCRGPPTLPGHHSDRHHPGRLPGLRHRRGLTGRSVPAPGFAGPAAEPLAISLVTLSSPSSRWWSANSHPNPLELLAIAARPAVWALSRATELIVRLLGGNPHGPQQHPSPEELHDIVISHRGLTTQHRTIISSALEIHERARRALLLPRRDVFTLPDDMPATQARLAPARAGHPVPPPCKWATSTTSSASFTCAT